MPCEKRLCQCRSSTDWAWRRFFKVWEDNFTPEDERALILRSEHMTGVKYSSTMVDKKPET